MKEGGRRKAEGEVPDTVADVQTSAAESEFSPSASRLPSPSVSVILVSWNTRALLDACLESLREQVEDAGADLWVVDNDSTDASADMVAERHPWAHLIRNSGNVGFARACNLVLPRSDAPYLFFFNPDATLDPGALETLLDVMAEHPKMGAIMPRLLDGEGRPTHFIGRAPRILALRLRLTRMLTWRLAGNPAVRGMWERAARDYLACSATTGGPYDRDILEGAALFVRRSAMDAIGPFDPHFFCGWEESDLTIRLRRAGWGLGVTPLATARHWDSQSRVQWKWRHWEIPDGYYYMRKHHGRLGLWRHMRAERGRLKYHAAAGAPVEQIRKCQQMAFDALWQSPQHPGYAGYWPDAPDAVLAPIPEETATAALHA